MESTVFVVFFRVKPAKGYRYLQIPAHIAKNLPTSPQFILKKSPAFFVTRNPIWSPVGPLNPGMVGENVAITDEPPPLAEKRFLRPQVTSP